MIGAPELFAVALAAAAPGQAPADAVAALKSLCIDNGADMERVAAAARSSGWKPTTTNPFAQLGVFERETTFLKGEESDANAMMLEIGFARKPGVAIAICFLGVRPPAYQALRDRLYAFMGRAPSLETAKLVQYVYHQSGAKQEPIPPSVNPAVGRAELEKGPVYGIGMVDLSNVTTLLYSAMTKSAAPPAQP